MIDFSAVSPEIFSIIRSRDFVVDIYDDSGNKVIEPKEGRRFYIKGENHLVALVDSNENSILKVRLSKSADLSNLKGFIETLRVCANKYNMLFDVKRGDRDYEPKDFATEYAITNEGRQYMSDLTEGMHGTSRSSYLKLENARMIVRHSERINDEVHGARSRKVESIFVENDQGERFLFPTNQIAPARAMVCHVDNGGSFYDMVGQQITRMATDYQNLAQCSAFVQSNISNLAESAVSLRESCRQKLREMRRVFERCYRSRLGYVEETAKMAEMGEPVLVESSVLENIRETLSVEGKQLDESIIETVARLVGGNDIVNEDMSDAVAAGDNADEFVIVRFRAGERGFEVEKNVWDDFQAGRLDLMSSPSFNSSDRMDKFSSIVAQVRDDRLLAVLGHVAETLPNLDDGQKDEKRKMEKVVSHTLKAVGESDAPIMTGALREFQEWFDSTRFDRIISENYNDYTDGEVRDEDRLGKEAQFEAIDDAASSFDVEEFLKSDISSEFGYGDHLEADPDDLTFDSKYITGSISSYLLDVSDVSGDTDEESQALSDHALAAAADLYPSVKAQLEMEGYILNEEGEDEAVNLEADEIEEILESTIGTSLKEGVGYEGVLTTNASGVWSSQGRGSNDDGVQGFYYVSDISTGKATLFVHDGEKAFDLMIEHNETSEVISGRFNTGYDLAGQVADALGRYSVVDTEISVSPSATSTVGAIETGAPEIADDYWGLSTGNLPDDWDFRDDLKSIGTAFEQADDLADDIDPEVSADNDFVGDDKMLMELPNEEEDDAVLTREDVLLPKDQGEDLRGEVASDIDNEEIERLAQRAGIKRATSAQLVSGPQTPISSTGTVGTVGPK